MDFHLLLNFLKPYMQKNDLTYSQIPLLIIMVILVYAHTVDVPFYLDDFSSIQENPVIYNWQGTLGEIVNYARLRPVGYLTFVANYQIHQFQVNGYHIINIFIHFLAGLAVWGLVRGLVRTPTLNTQLSAEAKLWLPLIVSLLFLLHPLQTQAVTYIVQRLASLAALFYLTAMACYVQARLTKHFIWIIGCILAIILAFLTKENTFTLPFAFILMELIFFQTDKKTLLTITGVTTLGSMIVGWLALAWILHTNPFNIPELITAIQAFFAKTASVSTKTYALTQLNTFWTYIRLFFIPIGLHIDYAYPLNHSLGEIRPILALAGHLLLFGGTFYILRKWLSIKENKQKTRLIFIPFLSFGILFYYLAHAVESSVIPISDVIFEHRTYLPNFGFSLAVGGIIVYLMQNQHYKIYLWTAVVILISSLSIMTWYRNQLWRDPIALWSQNVKYAPEKQRAWIILGKHYIQADEPTKGLEALEKAIVRRKNPDGSLSITMTTETLLNMVVALRRLNRLDEALEKINQALQTPLRPFDKAKFLVNQGNIFYEQQKYTQAEAAYRQALEIYPQNLNARLNLANVLFGLGDIGEAEIFYREILAIDPNNAIAQQNLNKVLDYKKQLFQ